MWFILPEIKTRRELRADGHTLNHQHIRSGSASTPLLPAVDTDLAQTELWAVGGRCFNHLTDLNSH
jgi:hypothetical protein